MATLKEVKTKISAVKKTRQITKAMNMVAASRLRGAQEAMDGFRPYAKKFSEVLGSLLEKVDEDISPLMTPHEEVNNIHLVLCTSDRGLCGGFNANLVAKAQSFMKEKGENVDFSFTNFGKKGRDWCRKNNFSIIEEHLGVVGTKVKFNVAATTGKKMIDGFLEGRYDEVYIICSEFISMARQVPVLQQILPMQPLEKTETEEDVGDEEQPYLAEHICEPSLGELVGDMLPKSAYVQLHSALLETSTSEHAARMAAMDNATNACNDMLDNLTLVYNKARQAAITAELMDIVGGAEALKG